MNSSDPLRDFTTDLVVTGRLWRKLAREVSMLHGVAEAGAGPLIWIGRLGENVRQNILAARCGIEGASLVRVLDDLAKAGFVTRTVDAADRRANLLQLTDAGREIVTHIEADLDALRQRVLGDVDPAELQTAMRLFARIRAVAEEDGSVAD